MFTDDVPAYVIDLSNDEPARWAEVIARESVVAGRLVQEAAAEFERVPEILRWVFARLYHAFGGLYRREIASWADALGVSVGTATMLNCAYELSHLRLPRPIGCTAGIRWVGDLGMVHVRNLDWPLATMGGATRLFRFRRGEREFVSVGVPGQVGVLSGMVPRAYSLTINWAPPGAFPSFDFGPTFLVRDTLETCDSYDAAVERLSETRLSTSVFFAICGVAEDQACIIERTQRQAVIRPITGPTLVQANHHIAERFRSNNQDLLQVVEGEEEFSLEGSSQRADLLHSALASTGLTCTLHTAGNALNTPFVLNKFTCQQMVFCPRTGDVLVWRRTGTEGCAPN
jgi:hypothetical protein